MWSILAVCFEKKKKVHGVVSLLQKKKDKMPDPNTSALKEVAIPVAVAALYNTSVFYLRSRDMYNTTYMHTYSVQ